MLHLPRAIYLEMVSHCLGRLPEEACGLLAGAATTGQVEVCYPAGNLAGSARLYTLDPRDHLRADRDAEMRGLEIIGVYHSHTHSAPYPSPTDVEQAPDPAWHYVLVSLAGAVPAVRSYSIRGPLIEEEEVLLRP